MPRPDRPEVVVAGCGATAFGTFRDASTPRDWVLRCAREALDDAGIEAAEVDAVVVGSESDFFSLQLAPGALLTDEIGLVPCPVIRVEMGGGTGAAAVRAGFMHIRSGMHRCVLVIGFEHAASHLSGDDMRMLYGLSFDPDIDGMAGATAANLYALSIAEHMRRYGTTEAQLAAVSVKNHGNALDNPGAHKPMSITVADVLASRPVSTPYKLLDCSIISDGAAAVVLTAGDLPGGRLRPRVYVAGSGCASDHVRLGDRPELHRFRSKERSRQAACAMAGIESPARQIDVAEVYDAFTGAELQGIEALGLGPAGTAGAALEAGEFSRDGRLPVNLSGGLIGQGGAPGATGVMQIVTLTRLLQGRYWPALQPQRSLRTALADAHGGIATVSVTHVLEARDE
ncbi:MAG: thiolase family protein [Betaproteobacteria bacterium]